MLSSAVMFGSPVVGTAWVSVEPDPAWPAAGVTIAATMVPAGTIRTAPDGIGGLLLAWQEARLTDPASCNCRNTDDLYVQRLDPAGRKTWSRTDVAICRWGGIWGGGESLAAFEPLAGGGALIAWIHGDGPSGTFAQRIAPDGALRWGTDGVTVFSGAMGFKWTARSAPDPGGGLWFGLDAPAETAVLVSRGVVSATGLDGALPVSVPLSGTLQTLAILPGDRSGRALIAAAVTVSGGRSRLEVIPVETGSRGLIRSRPAVPVATIPVDRVALAAEPDGAGGARLGWNAPSRTGFDLFVGAVRPDGSARWTRNLGPTAGSAAVLAPGPGAPGALVAWQPGAGLPLVATRLDDRGRPGLRVILGTSLRSERRAVVIDAPGGPLAAWIEWNGGEVETLRVAALAPAGPGGTTTPVEGLALLRREARITIEQLVVPAPGRAVILVHDAAGKALRAFGLRLR